MVQWKTDKFHPFTGERMHPPLPRFCLFSTSCSTFSPFLQLPFADLLYFANLFLRVALNTLGETLVSPKSH